MKTYTQDDTQKIMELCVAIDKVFMDYNVTVVFSAIQTILITKSQHNETFKTLALSLLDQIRENLGEPNPNLYEANNVEIH